MNDVTKDILNNLDKIENEANELYITSVLLLSLPTLILIILFVGYVL